MAKSTLEKTIKEAANTFALEIIEAVKNATLQELIAMQDSQVPKKPGRPQKAEPAASTSRTAKARSKKTTAKKPGRPAKATRKAAAVKVAKKRNYPKCAYPGCEKNRFARGKGFCGEHWRMSLDGKIKSADHYNK